MECVINAGPLIFLHKISRLQLLPALFDTVYIPKAVIGEIEAGGLFEARQLLSDVAYETLIVTNRLAVHSLLGRLHIGEAEVIVGAIEKATPVVVLDDMYARNKAKQLTLNVTGTLGLLLRARELGMIKEMREEVKNLINAGMYLSDTIIGQILQT